jgi:hypothetical protein
MLWMTPGGVKAPLVLRFEFFLRFAVLSNGFSKSLHVKFKRKQQKKQEFFNNIPFLVNFEIFCVKFEFKFCGRPTVIFRFDTPWG